MKYRMFGRTGLWVSEVSLGAMTIGGSQSSPVWQPVGALGAADSERLVNTALDAGINLIDTADMYGDGGSEELLGKILTGRRDQVVLATKAGARVGAGHNQVGNTRVHLTRSIEASLRRLGTDYIDLYQLHMFDDLTPLEESLAALDDAVRAGKIRHIGVSNFAAWQVSQALGISAARQFAGLTSLQTHYSLLVRDIETEIVPMAQNENVALMIWGPLAGGYLSGKYDRAGATTETGARRALAPAHSLPPVDPATAAPVVDATRAVAERLGATVPQVALAWLLTRPAVTTVLLGARTPEQLTGNIAAVDLSLGAEDLAELDAASAFAPRYPGWVAAIATGMRALTQA